MKTGLLLVFAFFVMHSNAQMKKLFYLEKPGSVTNFLDSIQTAIGQDYVYKGLLSKDPYKKGMEYSYLFEKSDTDYVVLDFIAVPVSQTDSAMTKIKISGLETPIVSIWKMYFNANVNTKRKPGTRLTSIYSVDAKRSLIAITDAAVAKKFAGRGKYISTLLYTLSPNYTIKTED